MTYSRTGATAEPSSSRTRSIQPSHSQNATNPFTSTNSISCVPGVPIVADVILELSPQTNYSSGSTFSLAEFISVGVISITITPLLERFFLEAGNASTSIGVVRNVTVNSTTSVVIVISLTGSYIGVLSHTDMNVLSIQVGIRAAGRCVPPDYVAHLSFSWPVEASDRASALQHATSVTYQASTITTSILGNPVTAMSTTNMISVLGLQQCVFSDVDAVSSSVSPLGVAIGPEIGQYYRGAVLAGLAVYAAAAALATLTALLLRIRDSDQRERPMSHHFATIRCPSLGLVVIGQLHQGLATSSASLVRLNASPFDLVLGSAGILCCSMTVAWAALVVVRGNPCRIVDREMTVVTQEYPRLGPLLRFALWRKRWDDDSGTLYKRRYLLLIDDLRLPQWTSVELAAGLLEGVVLGIRKNDLSVCRGQNWVLTGLCFFMMSASLHFQPRGAVSSNLFLVLGKTAAFVTSAMILLHTYLLDAKTTSAAEFMTSVTVFLSTLEVVTQVVVTIIVLLPLLSRITLPRLLRKLNAIVGGGSIAAADETTDDGSIEIEGAMTKSKGSSNRTSPLLSPLLAMHPPEPQDDAVDDLLDLILAEAPDQFIDEHDEGDEFEMTELEEVEAPLGSLEDDVEVPLVSLEDDVEYPEEREGEMVVVVVKGKRKKKPKDTLQKVLRNRAMLERALAGTAHNTTMLVEAE